MLRPTRKREVLIGLYEKFKSNETPVFPNNSQTTFTGDALNHAIVCLDKKLDRTALPDTLERELINGNDLPKIFSLGDFACALLMGLNAHNVIGPRGRLTLEFERRNHWWDMTTVDMANTLTTGPHRIRPFDLSDYAILLTGGPKTNVPPVINELLETRIMWASIFTPFLTKNGTPAKLETLTCGKNEFAYASSLYKMLSFMGKQFHKDIKVTKVYCDSDYLHIYTQGETCDSLYLDCHLFGYRVKLSHTKMSTKEEVYRRVGQIVRVKSKEYANIKGPLWELHRWRIAEHANPSTMHKHWHDWRNYSLEQRDLGIEYVDNPIYTTELEHQGFVNEEMKIQSHFERLYPQVEYIEYYQIIKEYYYTDVLDQYEQLLNRTANPNRESLEPNTKPLYTDPEVENEVYYSSFYPIMSPGDAYRDEEQVSFPQWMVLQGYWSHLDLDAEWELDCGETGRDVVRMREKGDTRPKYEINDNWWHVDDNAYLGYDNETKEVTDFYTKKLNRNNGREYQFPPNWSIKGLKQFGEEYTPVLDRDKDPREVESYYNTIR